MTADWDDWPLVQIRIGDTPEDEIPDVVWQALRAALDRNETFAAVVEMPTVASRRGRIRDAARRVRMVKQLRPGLAERCRGLAFVMPAEALRENEKTIRSASKIWGCPTTAVDDFTQGREWARGRL
jgi:hypothetical protein